MPSIAFSREDPPRLLLADDDPVLRSALAAALARRGFRVVVAQDPAEARALARAAAPEYAVVDLRMPGGSGLALLKELLQLDPRMRVVMLTGFASIATAIESVRLGARYYLAKPVTADDIVAALRNGKGAAAVSEQPLTVGRLEWEHIQRVLAANGGNVSATARQLGMHRRTLQRKLGKKPQRETAEA